MANGATQPNPPELVELVKNYLSVVRGLMIEAQRTSAKLAETFTARDSEFNEHLAETDAASREVYNNLSSPEFVAFIEKEVAHIREAIAKAGESVNEVDVLKRNLQDQLVKLRELDQKLTETLLQYKV